jgi:hypothetical protein
MMVAVVAVEPLALILHGSLGHGAVEGLSDRKRQFF